MVLVRVLVGIAVLVLGRQLFWLFVAAVGFIYGMDAAGRFMGGQPDLVIVGVALVFGAACAVLAYFLQWAAVAVAGFLVGGRMALAFLSGVGWPDPESAWIVFTIGGVIGALLVIALFDWALIILSSLMGAALIAEAVHLRPGANLAGLLALALVGIVIQAGATRRGG